MALLAVAVMFTGCSEDGYWDEYTEEGAKYSFAQSTASFSYLATDEVSQVSVNVFRNDTKGAVTLPVTATVSDEILVAPESVSFADGSNVAEYVVAVNGEMTMGKSYTISVSFEKENASVSGSNSCAISMVKDYTWESAGKVTFASDWAGVTAKLNIQRAAEYDGNYYRILSPYYYLEPSYCPNPGYHLYFYLDENYEPLDLPRVQNIGETASAGGYWNLYYVEGLYDYCEFVRQDNIYIIRALWVTGDASMGYTPTYYAEEMFQWTEGWPLAQ